MPAVNLVDIWASSTSKIRQGVIQVIIDEAVFMAGVPIFNNPLLRSTFFREALLPNVAARRLNKGYELTKGTFEKIDQDLTPIGGEFQIDNKIARIPVGAGGGPDQASQQLMMHARATGLLGKRVFVTGDPLNGEPPGLRHWLETELQGQSLLYNGVTNTTGENLDDRQEFITNMNILDSTTLGLPTFYLSNEDLGYRVDALFMDGPNSIVPGLYNWREVEIRPGMSVNVASWRGRPWFFAKDDHQAQQILQFNELNPDGVAKNTSSIYSVRVGEDMFAMEQDREPEIVRDSGTTSSTMAIDWAITTIPKHPRSLARLSGILQPV